MQALILAAGRGSRLGKRGEDTPKCLLEIGRRPTVEHQLEALADAGVGPVAMVIGYCADEIRTAVGLRAEYIHNARWMSTNSLSSFHLAREWVDGPLVVINSDVLFHPEILHRLLAAGGDAIAYDSGSGGAPEQMKVRVVDGQLVNMSKDMPADQISGENVGILSFTAETCRLLFEKAGELLEAGKEQSWLGEAVRDVARERSVRAVDVAGLPWVEIDTAHDLDLARRVVWPAIGGRPRRLVSARWIVALALALGVAVPAAFLAGRSTAPVRTESWDLEYIRGTEPTTLLAGDRRQSWGALDPEQRTAMEVVGPGTLRIDSRLLLAGGAVAADEVPYVLVVELDGKLVDWFKESGRPSGTWTHPEWTVCKLRGVDVTLPEGRHELTVGFQTTGEGRACALRLRQREPVEPGGP